MILHFAFINNSVSVKAQFMLPYKNAQFGLVMCLTRTPSFPQLVEWFLDYALLRYISCILLRDFAALCSNRTMVKRQTMSS